MKDTYQPPQRPTQLSELQVKALIKFGAEHPDGSSFNEYITSFPELSGVTKFNVSKHNLGSNVENFIKALPKSTEILILSECGITLEYFEATLKCISNKLINISFLDLSMNTNEDNDTNNIKLLEFPPMPASLKFIDLGINNFGKHIFSLVKILPISLLGLSIYGNKMGKDALEIFEIIASRLSHLESLEADFLGNEVDTLGILKSIGKIASLTHLEFTGNNLDKDCLEILKTFPSKLLSLKEIDIRSFNPSIVNAEDIAEIAKWFDNHNKLFESWNECLFSGFKAYKDSDSSFCLNQDVMSYLIGNHYEPVVQLITQSDTPVDTFD